MCAAGGSGPCNFADGAQPVCKGCAPRTTATCARCGCDRPPTARWPDGPVCEPCYRAALHRRGRCADCGRQRRLVPAPLATLLGALIDTPRAYIGVGAPATTPWLFPGLLPGRPLTPARLGQRLGKLGIDARAGRRAALIHLAAQLPAAVLADLLHLTPATAVRWVNNAGGDWSRYAAAIATNAITNQTE